MTTTSALELAKTWKKLMSEAEELLSQEEATSIDDCDRALEILNKALSTIETLGREHAILKGGAEDLRLAETLERIGFAYYCRGMFPAAESALRRALKITQDRIIGYFTATSAAQNLARVLDKLGKGAEAIELRAEYPEFEDPPADEVRPAEALERILLTTLYTLFGTDATSSEVVPLMEELLGHIETVFGSDHEYTIDALHRTGECNMRLGRKDRAMDLFTRAYKISAARKEENKEEIASCMRKLATTDPQGRLGKAFSSKARAIGQEGGIETLADSIISKILAKSGPSQQLVMPVEEAEIVIDQWEATLSNDGVPFVSLTLNNEQRYRQLLSMFERAIAIAEVAEKGSEAPLSTLNLLAEMADCHKELGEDEKAKELKERELKLIAEHWGEGHVMYVEAVEDYEENFQDL